MFSARVELLSAAPGKMGKALAGRCTAVHFLNGPAAVLMSFHNAFVTVAADRHCRHALSGWPFESRPY
ncbi:hypothetical protein L905_13855 [Agrobacterium sp. TS43]|nr:hypothetical protein L905_13855 [Agrobacterium sp. TS43]